MKIKKALVGSILFIALLFIYYYVHIKFLRVDVVFYSAILDGVLAALTAAIILAVIPYFKLFTKFEKIQMLTIWILTGYIFAISVPTLLDRSLSFYILEKIQQRGGGILQSGFEEVFTKEYVKEHRLVDVRLTEQKESGTIKVENGCVKLTERGIRLANFSRFFRKNLLPKHRLLMGEYTDDLTDPFGHGSIDENATFNYICK
jgi:hypothetical protein